MTIGRVIVGLLAIMGCSVVLYAAGNNRDAYITSNLGTVAWLLYCLLHIHVHNHRRRR